MKHEKRGMIAGLGLLICGFAVGCESDGAGSALAFSASQPSKALETQWLKCVKFVGPSAGWAAGSGGTLIHTEDGGRNWSFQDSGVSSWMYGMDFASSSRGWVVGAQGRILATTDAGASWLAQDSGTTALLFGVSFAGTQTGFAVGESGTILKTVD